MPPKRKTTEDPAASTDEPAAKKQNTKMEPITVDFLLKDVAPDWRAVLEPEMKKSYFTSLLKYINTQYSTKLVHPPPEKIFAAFSACPLSDVRVVILGQDPYPTPGNAHGLCFSVEVGVAPPQSLKNIYKELTEDPDVNFTAPKPPHGNLMSWAQQGVLLLNTVLTVETRKANSHKAQGWEQFTDFIVTHINQKKNNVVFLLWGKPSEKKGSQVSQVKHHVVINAHPSPLSASKGFFGCRCFSKTNKYLKKTGQKEIDWQLPSLADLKKT